MDRFHYVLCTEETMERHTNPNPMRLNLSAIGEVSLDQGREKLSRHPSIVLECLGIAQLAPPSTPATFRGRTETLQNDFNQLRLIAEASMKNSKERLVC